MRNLLEDRGRVDSSVQNRNPRVFEEWEGNNQFCFDGRIVAGPGSDNLLVLSVWAYLLVTPSMFFMFVCPLLIKEHPGTLAVACVVVGLWVATCVSMASVQLCDPGIVPRAEIVSRLLRSVSQERTEAVDRNSKEASIGNSYVTSLCITCKHVKEKGAQSLRRVLKTSELRPTS